MTDPTTALLERHLDAWGRAELHSASKALPDPGPAFTNAVGAEAKYQRVLNRVVLLALLLVLVALAVVAYIRSNPPSPAGGDDVILTKEIRTLSPLPLVR